MSNARLDVAAQTLATRKAAVASIHSILYSFFGAVFGTLSVKAFPQTASVWGHLWLSLQVAILIVALSLFVFASTRVVSIILQERGFRFGLLALSIVATFVYPAFAWLLSRFVPTEHVFIQWQAVMALTVSWWLAFLFTASWVRFRIPSSERPSA